MPPIVAEFSNSAVVKIAILAFCYFVAAKASLLLAIPPGYASPVWPPSGIALAALLALGQQVWPGVWLGAALANFYVGAAPELAAEIATGNTLAAIFGMHFVHRYVGASAEFDGPGKVFRFAGVAAAGSVISSATGVSALLIAGSVAPEGFFLNWYTWWQGDTTGIVVVTPLLLAFTGGVSARQDTEWQIELLSFGALLACAFFVVFGGWLQPEVARALTFVLIPFMAWAGCRFDLRVVTSTIVVVSVLAIWATGQHLGPFQFRSLNETLLVLEAFTGTVTLMGLVLCALTRKRQIIEAALEASRDHLTVVVHELHEQAVTDSLTGLYNRRHMSEILRRELLRAGRYAGSLAVLMADIDYFKRVNDTFGHEAGDLVLVQVAGLLRNSIRGSDIACRFGGEEFVLVLPGANPDAALHRAESLRTNIKRLKIEFGGRPLGLITASVGLALHPDHADTAEALIRATDEALYMAKNSGRDRTVISKTRRVRVEAAPRRSV